MAQNVTYCLTMANIVSDATCNYLCVKAETGVGLLLSIY